MRWAVFRAEPIDIPSIAIHEWSSPRQPGEYNGKGIPNLLVCLPRSCRIFNVVSVLSGALSFFAHNTHPILIAGVYILCNAVCVMMQKTPIKVKIRPDFVASANYTGIAMYDVAEQTRRSTRRRARRRGVTCADGNCAEENGTHTEKSTPPLITGYAWIDSSIPLDKEELKKLAVVTKRLSQTGRPSDPLLDGLLCSLRYSTRGGPAPRGGSKYEWEQGTLVSFRAIVEKLSSYCTRIGKSPCRVARSWV